MGMYGFDVEFWHAIAAAATRLLDISPNQGTGVLAGQIPRPHPACIVSVLVMLFLDMKHVLTAMQYPSIISPSIALGSIHTSRQIGSSMFPI